MNRFLRKGIDRQKTLNANHFWLATGPDYSIFVTQTVMEDRLDKSVIPITPIHHTKGSFTTKRRTSFD